MPTSDLYSYSQPKNSLSGSLLMAPTSSQGTAPQTGRSSGQGPPVMVSSDSCHGYSMTQQSSQFGLEDATPSPVPHIQSTFSESFEASSTIATETTQPLMPVGPPLPPALVVFLCQPDGLNMSKRDIAFMEHHKLSSLNQIYRVGCLSPTALIQYFSLQALLHPSNRTVVFKIYLLATYLLQDSKKRDPPFILPKHLPVLATDHTSYLSLLNVHDLLRLWPSCQESFHKVLCTINEIAGTEVVPVPPRMQSHLPSFKRRSTSKASSKSSSAPKSSKSSSSYGGSSQASSPVGNGLAAHYIQSHPSPLPYRDPQFSFLPPPVGLNHSLTPPHSNVHSGIPAVHSSISPVAEISIPSPSHKSTLSSASLPSYPDLTAAQKQSLQFMGGLSRELIRDKKKDP